MPLDRSVALLRAIADSEDPLTFTELRERVGLPKATAHRLLTELVEHRLVHADEQSGRYRLGSLFLELAFRTWEQSDIRRVAEPHLRKLQGQVGETVHLGVREGDGVTYVDKLEARQHMRLFSAVGKHAPLHCTGVGKALLGALPKEELRSDLERLSLDSYTPNTLTKAADLAASVADLARYGYVLDMEEHELGVRCVAAPILDFRGSPVASISVTGPTPRMGLDRLRGVGPALNECARDVSKELGCTEYPFSVANDDGYASRSVHA